MIIMLFFFTATVANSSTLTYFNNGKFDKPILIVEGQDLTDEYSGQDYLNKILSNDSFKKFLEVEGFDLVVLNFNIHNAKKNIKELGVNFEDALNSIHLIKDGNHPVAVIGFSMGGLIARWQLKTMENAGRVHGVSLFVTYDSPHRGVTAPDDVIGGIKDLKDKIPGLFESNELKDAYKRYFSDSSKQMLIGSGSTFLSELEALGYPEQLVKAAIANGSGNGSTLSSLPLNAMIFDYRVKLGLVSHEYHSISEGKQKPCSYPCDKARPHNYDRAPGSTFNVYEQYWESLQNADKNNPSYEFDLDTFFLNTQLKDMSFINTLSALDIKNYDINSAITPTMELYGPFDKYAYTTRNKDHDFFDPLLIGGPNTPLSSWLLEFHKEGFVIPNRSNKKTPIGNITSSIEVEWLGGGRNQLSWTAVPGATRYEILNQLVAGDDYSVLQTTTGTFPIINISSTRSIAVRACNADQCGYSAFATAIYNTGGGKDID